MSEPILMRERVFKTGRQTLWRSGASFYMSISNRTYSSTQQVPIERVPLWLDYFDRR